jgi:hypothetical protein
MLTSIFANQMTSSQFAIDAACPTLRATAVFWGHRKIRTKLTSMLKRIKYNDPSFATTSQRAFLLDTQHHYM